MYGLWIDQLWKTNPSGSVLLSSGWSGTVAMSNYGSYLYIVSGSTTKTLYKVTPATGAGISIGATWTGTWSMTGRFN
jgi:hypothetical protein